MASCWARIITLISPGTINSSSDVIGRATRNSGRFYLQNILSVEAGVLRFFSLSSLALASIFLFVGNNSGASDALLSKNAVTITQKELAFYIADRLNPAVYDEALSRPGAIRYSLGNLYLIRRASDEAARSGLVDAERLTYRAGDASNRQAMEAYVAAQKEERADAVDWEALAQEEYLLNQERYGPQEQVKASHILISTDDRSFNEALAKLTEVQDQLNAGTPFFEVASTYSDDPSAERNKGSLGFFGKGQMHPKFEEAVFAMSAEGAISEPILTSFGIHLIRYEARRQSDPVPFSEVKTQLVKAVKAERLKKLKENIVEPLRTEISMELEQIDEAALKPLLLDLLSDL